jgi:hypothetical protein
MTAAVVLCLLGAGLAFPETEWRPDDGAAEALLKHGFENVAACRNDTQRLVTYENRVYRFEVRALREAARIIVDETGSRMPLILILQYRGIPAAAAFIRPAAAEEGGGGAEVRVSMDVEPYWSIVKDQPKSNPSRMKLDMTVSPEFNLQFGSYADAVESQVNAVPAVATLLRRGLTVNAEWIVPLQNELGREGGQARPGLLTVNQTIRGPRRWFASATFGYFTEHRWGADLEIRKYWRNGRWTAGASAGFTGFAAYFDDVWYYSGMKRWTGSIDCGHRFAKYNLAAGASFGRFLHGDEGFRFDVSKPFGEVVIGFFGIRTNEGANGGLALTIPVFPPKRPMPRRFRVSPAPAFRWAYRYRGLPLYGLRYGTGNRIDDWAAAFNPDFMEYWATQKKIE